jgi:hypothetical protein
MKVKLPSSDFKVSTTSKSRVKAGVKITMLFPRLGKASLTWETILLVTVAAFCSA